MPLYRMISKVGSASCQDVISCMGPGARSGKGEAITYISIAECARSRARATGHQQSVRLTFGSGMDGDQPISALRGRPQGQGGGRASRIALHQLYMTYTSPVVCCLNCVMVLVAFGEGEWYKRTFNETG